VIRKLLYRVGKDRWKTTSPFEFTLEEKVTDVKDFATLLYHYLKTIRLPFHYERIEVYFEGEYVDNDFQRHWDTGIILLYLKKPWRVKLDIRYDKFTSPYVIKIEFHEGSKCLRVWSEEKDMDYYWRMSLEQIEKFYNIMRRFAAKDFLEMMLYECAKRGN
jgi:hypothetical protein